jgi:hypothetical protein
VQASESLKSHTVKTLVLHIIYFREGSAFLGLLRFVFSFKNIDSQFN